MKKFYAVRYFLLFVLVGMIGGKGWGQTTYVWKGTNGTWLTGTNWTPTGPPTGNTSIAAFTDNTGTGIIGINMNGISTANSNLGGIFYSSAATTSRTINNSSTTAAGVYTLNGATINSVANTIIDNSSSAIHTITNGSSQNLGIALGNTTNNIISISSTGGITISSIISGSNKLTKAGSGTGVLLLSAANTYSGVTTISAGTLRLGVANAIPVAATGGGVVLNGGILSTGASTGFSDGVLSTTNMGTLTLSESSTIALGTGSHSLFFAASNATSWTAAKTITISGWTGTPGGSGTAGKIFVGSETGLTPTQLAQITFTGNSNGTTILSTGEVVPAAAPINNFYSKSTGNLNDVAAWGKNTDGSGTTPSDFTTANQIFNIRNNATPTIGGNWTVSGSGSKIVEGDGTNAINFTIPSAFAVTGTIDVSANATLTNANTANPTLGILAATSTVAFTGTSAQTVPAATYGNLTVSTTGGNATAAGATGVSGVLTVSPGSIFDLATAGVLSGAFTISGTGTIRTASTSTPLPSGKTWTTSVAYNSSSAQTVVTGTYTNLDLSGGARTLPAGIVSISGVYTPGSSTAVSTSTIDFSSASAQTIPAANYYNITNSGNGARTLAGSGTISIANTLSLGSGTYTVTGSTVSYTATSGTIAISLPAVISGNSYNILTINGTGGTFTLPASATNQNLATTLNVQAGTFRLNTSNTISNIISVGTVNLSGGTFDGTAGTIASPGTTLQISTAWNQTGGTATTSGSGTAKLVFTGGGTPTFTGLTTTSFIFWTIQVSNNTTLTLASNVSVNGISSPGTVLTVDAGSTLNAATFTTTSNISGNVAIINGRFQTTNLNGFSGSTTASIISTNITTITIGTASAIEYNAASGTQVVTPRTDYNNVIISGGGTKTSAAATTVSGNFTISSGTFSLSSTLSVKGNWSNAGTFTPNTSTVTFNGTAAQNYTRTGTGSFNNLTLNNTNGLTLNNDITVGGVLTFTAGKITTGTNKVIIPSGGSISGAAAGTGWVAGNLQKNIAVTGPKDFEIGGPSSYRPVNFNATAVTTAGDVIASVTQADGLHPAIASSLLSTSKTIVRYFTLTNSGFAGTYTATFNFVAADVPSGASPGNFIVGRYNGSSWTYPNVGTKAATSTQIVNASSFGDFAIGESSVATTITATALSDFGNVCVNTTAGPNTFTINGSGLTTDNVTVAALAGYAYSLDNSTYSTSLTIPQSGGTFSQLVYVKFSPAAVQSYNGNIVIGGGGAADYNAPASGSGVNAVPSVTTGSAGSITATGATLSGTITANGCSTVTGYGIEYSLTNNFTPGTGTPVAGSNLSGGAFSVNLSSLTANTTYYYLAYATNSGGTRYGAQASFTTVTRTFTVSALTGFGNVCINTVAGPNSFNLSENYSDGSDITIGALSGFTYSLSSSGTYTSTLTLPAFSGASTLVYVKFAPTAVQSYNGNILVSGGGATSINVAASGSGINTAPTVATVSPATNITSTSATLSGTLSSAGCSAVTAYGIEYSTTSGFANGTGTKVTGANLSGTAYSATVGSLTPATTYYFKAFATNAGGTSYGSQVTFVTATPAITVSTISTAPSFTSVCTNTTAGPKTFTISGTNLTTADVTVAALSVYTYSLDDITYTSTLTIPQPGGTLASTTIYVKFSPVAAQTYSGTITVAGGGASSKTVSVTGTGVNTAPTVTASAATSVTQVAATLPGTITVTGCTAISAYGLYYSTSSGFADGSGTQIVASNLSGSNYSVSLAGLSANTTYYYKAYATNGAGTSYSSQLSFTTSGLDAPDATNATSITSTGFTANWNGVTGATGYRLDVATNNSFSTSSTITEGFNSVGTNGSPAPTNWTFTAIGGTYTTTGNYGVSSPSLQFDNSADRVQTPTLSAPATSLSFWIKLQGSSTISALLVEGYNGTSWVTIENYDNLPTTGTTVTYNGSSSPALPSGIVQFRFTYTKSSGNLSFDDVSINFTTSSFYVPGYQNLSVTGTSQVVTGLTPSNTYYYRVRATSTNSTSDNSDTITVQTCPNAPAAPGNISGPNPACPNTAGLTYSISAVSTATTYNWTVPTGWTITSGQGSTSIIVTSGNLGQSGNISVTAQNCGGTSSATSLAVSVGNTWTGATSTNWFVGSNWSCGSVPAATDNAVIPVTANKPVLTNATAIADLTIASGTNITLNGQTFTINGTVSGTGVLTGSNTSSLVIGGSGGSGTIYFDQSTDSIKNVLSNLTVNRFGNISLGSKLYVLNVLTLSNGDLNTFNNLVLRSISNEVTARVAPVASGASIQGNVTVERYFSAIRSYRFVTPSVNTNQTINSAWMEGQQNTATGYSNNKNSKSGYGTHITGLNGATNGFDQTATNAASLYTWDNGNAAAGQKYYAVTTTTASGNLVAGKGYRLFIRGSRSVDLANNSATPSATILRATGQLNIGTITFDATTSTPLSIRLNNTKDGYSFIGNPYASPVSLKALKRTNITPTYYFYDPHVRTQGVYVTYNSFTGVSSIDSSGFDDNLQSGQGFFIQTSDTANKTAAIEFEESDKTTVNKVAFRTTGVSTQLSIKLLLNTSSGTRNTADGSAILFDSAYSTAIGDEDSRKFNNVDENLAIRHDTIDLSIEGRPNIVTADTLHLKIWQYRQKSYYLRLDGKNFNPDITAFVKDSWLNTETQVNLNDSTVIPFSITTDSASFAADRFMIVFKSSGVLPVTLTNVKAYQKEKGIQVDWISRTESNINHYEVEKSYDGWQFEKTALLAAKGNNSATVSYGWFDETPVEGANFYRIKVIEKSGAVKYTQVVKVTIGKAGSSFTVYPNPVKGNTISLHLVNMPKGKYNINLYNNLGQRILSKVIVHDGLSANHTISTGRVMSKGAYRLNAVNGESEINTTVVFE